MARLTAPRLHTTTDSVPEAEADEREETTPGSAGEAPIAFILKGYPRLSESFIAQEIRSLEGLGLAIQIISLRHPTDPERHPLHDDIKAPVNYLPEYLYQEPLRVIRAWHAVRRYPGYQAAHALWLRDLVRDPSANRIRRFGQAVVLAFELPAGIERLHAHFLHTPASVARYTAAIRGLEWSVSAHAKDVWTTPDWEIGEKLAECAWLVTCSEAAFQHLSARAPDENERPTVRLIYHGLDLDRFPPPAALEARRDGSHSSEPVRLLTVGRAVEKKGYPDLLAALAALPDRLAWRLEQIGDGPLLEKLKAQARAAGIAERIAWRGALAQDDVLAAYRRADFFVLASRVDATGDRDGLPNVLLEAQSQGLACVATRVSGIPELIIDGETGCLVAERSPVALAASIEALIGDPKERRRLGDAGARRVREAFDHAAWTGKLAAIFASASPGVEAPACE